MLKSTVFSDKLRTPAFMQQLRQFPLVASSASQHKLVKSEVTANLLTTEDVFIRQNSSSSSSQCSIDYPDTPSSSSIESCSYELQAGDGKYATLGKIADIYDRWRNPTVTESSIGTRTGQAILDLLKVVREWGQELYTFCLTLMPDVTSTKEKFAGFFAFLLTNITHYAKSTLNGFWRVYAAIKNLFFPSTKEEKKESDPMSLLEPGIELQAGDDESLYDSVTGCFSKVYRCILRVVFAIVGSVFPSFGEGKGHRQQVGTSRNIIADMLQKINLYNAFKRLDLKDMFKRVVDYVYHLFSGSHYYIEFEISHSFDKLGDELAALLALATSDDSKTPNTLIAQQIYQKTTEYDRVYVQYVHAYPKEAVISRTRRSALMDCAQKFLSVHSSQMKRISPVSACFFGPPGLVRPLLRIISLETFQMLLVPCLQSKA